MRSVSFVLAAMFSLLFSLQAFAAEKKTPPQTLVFPIEQTVLKQRVADGVSADDAIEALKSRAAEVNMKFVAHQPLSKELEARGIKSGRLEIFQFCNPEDAHRMVQHNPIMAAYMPCRIALVEDKEGVMWLMMMNLDLMIDNAYLPDNLREMANEINFKLLSILDAGSTGEF